MKRAEAIARLAQRPGASHITSSSIHFANINAAKDVWWLDIPITKLSQPSELNIILLLYDHRSGTLYHLEIPKTYFRQHQKRLVVRREKGCISLELSAEQAKMFRDVRPKGGGVEFRQFLQNSIA